MSVNTRENVTEMLSVLLPLPCGAIPVSVLVKVVSVRRLSDVSDNKRHIDATEIEPADTQKQRSMSWPLFGKTWSDRSDGWKSSASQTWRWMVRC